MIVRLTKTTSTTRSIEDYQKDYNIGSTAVSAGFYQKIILLYRKDETNDLLIPSHVNTNNIILISVIFRNNYTYMNNFPCNCNTGVFDVTYVLSTEVCLGKLLNNDVGQQLQVVTSL